MQNISDQKSKGVERDEEARRVDFTSITEQSREKSRARAPNEIISLPSQRRRGLQGGTWDQRHTFNAL